MRLSNCLLFGAVTLGAANPLPEPEQEFGAAQLESRATPYDLLSSYAHDLLIKPVLAHFLKDFLPQSTQVVDLSQRSLSAISGIMQQAIEASWFARDKTKVGILVQNSRDYTRLNITEPQISNSLAVARDYHEDANEILNYLSLYGLQAAPSFQTIVGIYILFKKEEIALTKDLDALVATQNHLIKFQGFQQRLGELLKQLKGYGTNFNGLPGQLFQVVFKESGAYPCPGCICKKKSHNAYFQSRPNPSAPWNTVKHLEQTWPYCGKRPSSKIERHRDIIRTDYNDAKQKYLDDYRDDFLTTGYDALVSDLEAMATWDVDRLVSSLFVQDPQAAVPTA